MRLDIPVTHNSLTVNLDRLELAYATIAATHPTGMPVITPQGRVPRTRGKTGALSGHRWRYRWLLESIRSQQGRRVMRAAPWVLADVRLDIDDVLGRILADAPLRVMNVDAHGDFVDERPGPLDLTRAGRPVLFSSGTRPQVAAALEAAGYGPVLLTNLSLEDVRALAGPLEAAVRSWASGRRWAPGAARGSAVGASGGLARAAGDAARHVRALTASSGPARNVLGPLEARRLPAGPRGCVRPQPLLGRALPEDARQALAIAQRSTHVMLPEAGLTPDRGPQVAAGHRECGDIVLPGAIHAPEREVARAVADVPRGAALSGVCRPPAGFPAVLWAMVPEEQVGERLRLPARSVRAELIQSVPPHPGLEIHDGIEGLPAVRARSSPHGGATNAAPPPFAVFQLTTSAAGNPEARIRREAGDKLAEVGVVEREVGIELHDDVVPPLEAYDARAETGQITTLPASVLQLPFAGSGTLEHARPWRTRCEFLGEFKCSVV